MRSARFSLASVVKIVSSKCKEDVITPTRGNERMAHRIVSADSHVMEPGDLWQERLDRSVRDRAPRVVENTSGHGPRFVFMVEGAAPFPIAGGFAAGAQLTTCSVLLPAASTP